MSIALQLVAALVSVAVLLMLMVVLRRVAGGMGISGEVQRKLVHVTTGLFAMALPWLFPDRWPVYMLLGLTLIALTILRLPRLSAGLGEVLHAVERRSYGDFLLTIAIGLCFFLADGVALYYVLPIAVLTLADAAAAVAGTAYGRTRYVVENGHKTIEGSVVFFVITLLISLICLMFLSPFPPAKILMLSLLVAAFGTLVEAQSWRGFDNLFLPLGLLVFLAVHSTSTIMELAWLVGLFVVAIMGFRGLGPRFGVSPHAAGVYVVALFLILAVVDVQNALLPALVLLAHAWASLRNPGQDDFDDLDIVASLALFSFFWLAIGTGMGWNAVQFYLLTATGLVMGLATLALRQRWLLIVGSGAVLWALWTVIAPLNPDDKRWAEPLWPVVLISLTLCAALPGVRPGWFVTNRILKLTVLAITPAVIAFFIAIIAQPVSAQALGIAS